MHQLNVHQTDIHYTRKIYPILAVISGRSSYLGIFSTGELLKF